MRLLRTVMQYNSLRVIIAFIIVFSIYMMLRKRWFEEKIKYYLIAIILIFIMCVAILPVEIIGKVFGFSSIILIWAMGISKIVQYFIQHNQISKIMKSPPTKICLECGKETKVEYLKNGLVFRCVDYPNCNYAESIDGKTRMCPKCGSRLKIKRVGNDKYYKCSNTRECDYTEIILNDKNI